MAMKKTTEEASESEGVVIFLVGESYGAADGDRRTTDAETAENLVAAGLARYAKSKTD